MREKMPIVPILIGLAGITALILLFGLGGGDDGSRRLQSTVIGTRVLGPWLKSGDIAVEASNPSLTPAVDSMGMRILPLYDMDLYRPAEPVDTRQAAFQASSLVDIEGYIYHNKIDELPTLVILPKWRQGILAVEVAHESLLIPAETYVTLFDQIELGTTKLTRGGPVFTTGTATGDLDGKHAINLFHAQLFYPPSLPAHCKPTVSLPQGALVVFCTEDGQSLKQGDAYVDLGDKNLRGVHFLSDPDLMNNHGLRLAGNAGAARAIVSRLNADTGKPVYLDISTELLLVSDAEPDTGSYYQRDLGDFGRLFTPPFNVLWAMLLLVMTILFWRGSVRIVPPRIRLAGARETAGSNHPGLAAVAAKARLLRLGGHDGRMIKEFVQSEIARVAVLVLGKNPGNSGSLSTSDRHHSTLTRLHAVWSRRDPERADRLLADAKTLTGRVEHDSADRLSPTERTRTLTNFRENLEILTHENADSGRIPGTRRRSAP